MLKNIFMKLTPVAILFILITSSAVEIPQNNSCNTNSGITLCHDLDSPIEKD